MSKLCLPTAIFATAVLVTIASQALRRYGRLDPMARRVGPQGFRNGREVSCSGFASALRKLGPNCRSAAKTSREIGDEFSHGFTRGEEVLAVEQAFEAIDPQVAANAGIRT